VGADVDVGVDQAGKDGEAGEVVGDGLRGGGDAGDARAVDGDDLIAEDAALAVEGRPVRRLMSVCAVAGVARARRAVAMRAWAIRAVSLVSFDMGDLSCESGACGGEILRPAGRV
jgi:hypothetical protein